MMRIEAIIHPFKLDEVKDALLASGHVKFVSVSEVRGASHSEQTSYDDSPYVVELQPQVRVEVVVLEDLVKNIVDLINSHATVQDGEPSGFIFVSPIQDAHVIGTGESGVEVV